MHNKHAPEGHLSGNHLSGKSMSTGAPGPGSSAGSPADARFAVVGMRPSPAPILPPRRSALHGLPKFSAALLLIIVLGCLLSDLFIPHDPAYMDLMNYSKAPCRQFPFGTDTLGRDIFSMIWHGGRVSLLIGFFSTLISTAVAILVGAFSGLSPKWLDALVMRFTEIILSIPSLLLIVLLQAILGKPGVLSISIVIGLTSWTGIAKVVRTEVLRLRASEYVIASRCMGGGFLYVLWKHLAPNFISSIMFMVVMNVRSAIIAESTLSFMGIGLPLEIISWGSMLSLAEKALLTKAWWIILIPGAFLIATLLCVTSLGNALRKGMNRSTSKL